MKNVIVSECVWVCEKIIARTSFLIKKYAWLVSNVRERCKEEAVKICERIDVQLLRAEPAPIGRLFFSFRPVEIKNHSWHFRMSLQESHRTLNLVNRLIRPSAYLFQHCAATNHANKYPQAWADSEAAMTTATLIRWAARRSTLLILNACCVRRTDSRWQQWQQWRQWLPRPPQWPGSSKGNCRRATGREQERGWGGMGCWQRLRTDPSMFAYSFINFVS